MCLVRAAAAVVLVAYVAVAHASAEVAANNAVSRQGREDAHADQSYGMLERGWRSLWGALVGHAPSNRRDDDDDARACVTYRNTTSRRFTYYTSTTILVRENLWSSVDTVVVTANVTYPNVDEVEVALDMPSGESVPLRIAHDNTFTSAAIQPANNQQSGMWHLRVSDMVGSTNMGTLRAWSLSICQDHAVREKQADFEPATGDTIILDGGDSTPLFSGGGRGSDQNSNNPVDEVFVPDGGGSPAFGSGLASGAAALLSPAASFLPAALAGGALAGGAAAATAPAVGAVIVENNERDARRLPQPVRDLATKILVTAGVKYIVDLPKNAVKKAKRVALESAIRKNKRMSAKQDAIWIAAVKATNSYTCYADQYDKVYKYKKNAPLPHTPACKNDTVGHVLEKHPNARLFTAATKMLSVRIQNKWKWKKKAAYVPGYVKLRDALHAVDRLTQRVEDVKKANIYIDEKKKGKLDDWLNLVAEVANLAKKPLPYDKDPEAWVSELYSDGDVDQNKMYGKESTAATTKSVLMKFEFLKSLLDESLEAKIARVKSNEIAAKSMAKNAVMAAVEALYQLYLYIDQKLDAIKSAVWYKNANAECIRMKLEEYADEKNDARDQLPSLKSAEYWNASKSFYEYAKDNKTELIHEILKNCTKKNGTDDADGKSSYKKESLWKDEYGVDDDGDYLKNFLEHKERCKHDMYGERDYECYKSAKLWDTADFIAEYMVDQYNEQQLEKSGHIGKLRDAKDKRRPEQGNETHTGDIEEQGQTDFSFNRTEPKQGECANCIDTCYLRACPFQGEGGTALKDVENQWTQTVLKPDWARLSVGFKSVLRPDYASDLTCLTQCSVGCYATCTTKTAKLAIRAGRAVKDLYMEAYNKTHDEDEHDGDDYSRYYQKKKKSLQKKSKKQHRKIRNKFLHEKFKRQMLKIMRQEESALLAIEGTSHVLVEQLERTADKIHDKAATLWEYLVNPGRVFDALLGPGKVNAFVPDDAAMTRYLMQIGVMSHPGKHQRYFYRGQNKIESLNLYVEEVAALRKFVRLPEAEWMLLHHLACGKLPDLSVNNNLFNGFLPTMDGSHVEVSARQLDGPYMATMLNGKVRVRESTKACNGVAYLVDHVLDQHAPYRKKKKPKPPTDPPTTTTTTTETPPTTTTTSTTPTTETPPTTTTTSTTPTTETPPTTTTTSTTPTTETPPTTTTTSTTTTTPIVI
ncbi:hypothetical protein RI054_37g140430 [Pseudoscourfieldia marina]